MKKERETMWLQTSMDVPGVAELCMELVERECREMEVVPVPEGKKVFLTSMVQKFFPTERLILIYVSRDIYSKN